MQFESVLDSFKRDLDSYLLLFSSLLLFVFAAYFFISKKKRKSVDRLLAGSLGKQILILLSLSLVVVMMLSSLREILLGIDSKEGKLWSLIRFLDSGSVKDDSASLLEFTLAFVTSFTGIILLGGILISVLINYYNLRIDRYAKGYGNYLFKEHLIILGYDHMAMPLIRNFFESEEGKNKEIVLLTEQPVEEIRRYIRSNLSSKLERKIFILQGVRNIQEEIERLSPMHAQRIVILGEENEEGRDSKNMDCFNKLSKLIDKKRSEKHNALFKWINRLLKIKAKDTIPCYIQFEEQQSFRMAKDYDFVTKSPKSVSFYPFSFYELWAEKLFVNWDSFINGSEVQFPSLDYQPITLRSKKRVHLVLLGYNRMSHAMILAAGRVSHYPNFKKDKVANKSLITIIDKDAKRAEMEFKNLYPGIDTLEDIEVEFKEGDVLSEGVKTYLSNLNKKKKTELPYIVVCFSYSDFSLSIGMNLPRHLYGSGIPILIRQRQSHELHSQKAENVYFFGTEGKSIDFSLIESRDKKAQRYDKKYNQIFKYNSQWEKQEIKWTNRYTIDAYPTFKRSLFKKNGLDPLIDSSTLVDLEHRRWCAERVFAGWMQSVNGAGRIDDLKIHDKLKPMRSLDESLEERTQKLFEETISMIQECN